MPDHITPPLTNGASLTLALKSVCRFHDGAIGLVTKMGWAYRIEPEDVAKLAAAIKEHP